MPRHKSSHKKVFAEYVELNGTHQKITIYLEKRRNCRASIVRDGLNIRIPLYLSKKEQATRIQSLKEWGMQKLAQRPAQPHASYQDQAQLKVGAKTYQLNIKNDYRKSGVSWVDGHKLMVKLPAHLPEASQGTLCRKLVRRAIAHDHLPYMQEKVKALNERYFQQEIHRIRLRYNHSNWGSCSTNRNITISTRILLAPADVIDYVCIHELAHLIEPNHSQRFWQLVRQAMPDFRDKERWLKKHGHRCYF